ncbi:MAG: hypothetical protein QOJ54_3523 [Aliidongia sp.]|nr:hypothetical protein [Aliidongia sp.]
MSGSKSNRGPLVGATLVVLAAAIGAGVYFYQTVPVAPPTAMPPPAASLPVTAPAPAPASEANAVPVTDRCLVPGPAPAMPRGTVATADDMKIQHDAIQAFVKALEAYQVCVNELIEHPPAGTDEAARQVLVTLSNHAIDRANALADGFAEQERLFKARPPEAAPAK